ncbi:hypothetical protein GCM10020256_56770 [Streptomyces thermocoprophilus]
MAYRIASPNVAPSTVSVSRPGADADASHGCSSLSFSGTGPAQPPIPIRRGSAPGPEFSAASASSASFTGYVSPFTGAFS